MHMGINLKDIVELAKAGYKPSEVKELLTLATQSEVPASEGKEDQDEKTDLHDSGKEQPEEAPKKSTDDPKEEGSILSYKEKIEELEEKLRKAQSENVHKDTSDKEDKSDEEKLNEITALFM